MKQRFTTFAVLSCLLFLVTEASPLELVDHHGQRVDPVGSVQACLGCHDGTVASSVRYCTVQCDFKSSHAVLKHYPPRRNARQYAPLADVLAKGVRIQDGKVTCISCHDLNNPARNHPLISKQEKNFCRICHINL